MSLKRLALSVVVVVLIVAVYGWKAWHQQSEISARPAKTISGPAVILFRGDNDPSCQQIYQLVEDAAAHHDKRIQFVRVNWSDDDPLISHYKIRFLPSVIFIDQHGQEKLRIEGEGATVQQNLKQNLAQLDRLLLQ